MKERWLCEGNNIQSQAQLICSQQRLESLVNVENAVVISVTQVCIWWWPSACTSARLYSAYDYNSNFSLCWVSEWQFPVTVLGTGEEGDFRGEESILGDHGQRLIIASFFIKGNVAGIYFKVGAIQQL